MPIIIMLVTPITYTYVSVISLFYVEVDVSVYSMTRVYSVHSSILGTQYIVSING